MSRSTNEPPLIGCEVRPLDLGAMSFPSTRTYVHFVHGVPDKSGNLKMTSIRFDFTDITATTPTPRAVHEPGKWSGSGEFLCPPDFAVESAFHGVPAD